jgi:hypothetical protein
MKHQEQSKKLTTKQKKMRKFLRWIEQQEHTNKFFENGQSKPNEVITIKSGTLVTPTNQK